MANHTLRSSPDTIHWGYFEAGLRPALTVASGDTVRIEAVSGNRDVLPPAGFHVPPELLEIIEANPGIPCGPHILTGPVAVAGAMPDDMLEIRIEAVELRQDWGYNLHRPLAGTLPGDFPFIHRMNIPLDKARNRATLPWGLELELAPFFGVMGVAPPADWGRCTSIIPRAFGGNMDNKELVAGTTLFLPVFVEGALFSCGDGHGVQGDGEVNVTAIETALAGTFRFLLHKGRKLDFPQAETPTHFITTHTDPDLDRCAENALRAMIRLINERTERTPSEAYALCSLAADLRITQTVNQHKGVHCMIRKELVV